MRIRGRTVCLVFILVSSFQLCGGQGLAIPKGMRKSLRDVKLRLHPSLIFLLAYVLLVASVQFNGVVQRSGIPASEIPGRPPLWGLLFAFGLLASVAIHEYAHVWIALRQGIQVRGITLMMLGGVSEMDDIPHESHLREFRLALIGPVVSLLLGAFFLGIHQTPIPGAMRFYAYWLGTANIALGIFNLLPAFPLDGGRALRSLLARRLDFETATRKAVRVGRVFAWILGALGILSFNIILVLIALFIHASGQAELAQIADKENPVRKKLKELMIRSIETVEPDTPVNLVAQRMRQKNVGMIPVCQGNVLLGIITDRDITIRITAEDLTPDLIQARDIMSTPVVYGTEEEDVEDALLLMEAKGIRRLPVMNSAQRLVGVFSLTDVGVQLLRQQQKLAKAA